MENSFDAILKKIEGILSRSLPAFEGDGFDSWVSDTFGDLDCISADGMNGLLAPCRALVACGGKRWRPLLLVLSCKMATEDPARIENAFCLTPLLEFVHTASLIHDDIEDRATERRGKPCAYLTHGLDSALNAGSWLYFNAASCINSIQAEGAEKKAFYDLYAMEVRRLHLGQAMDIAWHRNPGLFPTTQEYSQMVTLKTGTLSSLAAKAGFFAGGADGQTVAKAGRAAAGIGMGFQVLDDVQNLTTGNPGKKRGDDIVEGKKSLVVLFHVEENPGDKEKIASLFKRAATEGIESPAVEEAITLFQKSGAVQRALDYGSRLVEQKALELTSILRDNKSGAREMILDLFKKIQR